MPLVGFSWSHDSDIMLKAEYSNVNAFQDQPYTP